MLPQVIARSGVLTVVPTKACSGIQPSGKKMKLTREPITFDDDNLEGTI